MHRYTARTEGSGYLSVGPPPPTFHTAAEAWLWLANNAEADEEEWGPGHSAEAIATMRREADTLGESTVHGPSGRSYTVRRA